MASNDIIINIQIPRGNVKKISVSTDCTVTELLQIIKDQEGLNMNYNSGGCPSCCNSQLIFRGKPLNRPYSKLSDYGVKHGSLLCVVFRALGGGLATVWYENGALQVGGPQQRQNYSRQIAEFSISTFHVSCKSDKIKGQNMMGIVLYLCDNKQLFYLNGMKCRSGYILLVNADKLNNINTKQGTMHSKAFKYFVGKDVKDMNIVGGGFAIKNGTVKFNSGTFNQATTKFHDGNREMHAMEKQCIEAAVKNWKNNVQNTKVSDLGMNGSCNQHGFY